MYFVCINCALYKRMFLPCRQMYNYDFGTSWSNHSHSSLSAMLYHAVRTGRFYPLPQGTHYWCQVSHGISPVSMGLARGTYINGSHISDTKCTGEWMSYCSRHSACGVYLGVLSMDDTIVLPMTITSEARLTKAYDVTIQSNRKSHTQT